MFHINTYKKPKEHSEFISKPNLFQHLIVVWINAHREQISFKYYFRSILYDGWKKHVIFVADFYQR